VVSISVLGPTRRFLTSVRPITALASALRPAILDAAADLPEHRAHPDQRRELRLRLYGLLLDVVAEKEIGALIDDLLEAGL
jgi:hypothetical protein